MLCQPATVSEAQGYIWDALGMAFKIKTASFWLRIIVRNINALLLKDRPIIFYFQ